MAALGKADMTWKRADCLLLTQSGHGLRAWHDSPLGLFPSHIPRFCRCAVGK
jgi:hypothetical protein